MVFISVRLCVGGGGGGGHVDVVYVMWFSYHWTVDIELFRILVVRFVICLWFSRHCLISQ